ncbi:hypothetical protein N7492_005720 [Penicillium capsulatum]|uniref:Uncharacterized protein n=1 Tax=Penicillium capsulatum TaxID=69766 RepID=A0A9W9LRE2_9EURO|nr:hypothetical protein N7492_005720 [Penicillium capsulatum]
MRLNTNTLVGAFMVTLVSTASAATVWAEIKGEGEVGEFQARRIGGPGWILSEQAKGETLSSNN